MGGREYQERAKELYEQVLDIDPQNADAWVGAQASSSNNSVAVGGKAQWNNEGGLIVTNGAGNSVSVGIL